MLFYFGSNEKSEIFSKVSNYNIFFRTLFVLNFVKIDWKYWDKWLNFILLYLGTKSFVWFYLKYYLSKSWNFSIFSKKVFKLRPSY